MEIKITSIRNDFYEDIKNLDNITSLKQIDLIKLKYFGKNGIITSFYKELKFVKSKEEKKFLGQLINKLKNEIYSQLQLKYKLIEDAVIEQELKKTKIDDVTLPINFLPDTGNNHIITITKGKLINFFNNLGFDIYDDIEIENEHNNFEFLNIPKYHPAREMQDTFYIDKENILRTHTTNFQSHIFKKKDLTYPIKAISIGKVFRKDEDDATHSHQFHQMDFIYVDKNINVTHLKGFLKMFVDFFFEQEKEIRYRPSYFPFTEPSVEVDIKCNLCKGIGCTKCSYTGYIEILGAGLINRKILDNNSIPKEYRGLAFGVGLERIIMLKHNITDIRFLYQNNLNFLSQFN